MEGEREGEEREEGMNEARTTPSDTSSGNNDLWLDFETGVQKTWAGLLTGIQCCMDIVKPANYPLYPFKNIIQDMKAGHYQGAITRGHYQGAISGGRSLPGGQYQGWATD